METHTHPPAPCFCSPGGRTQRSAPVYPQLSCVPVLGQGERRELGAGPRRMAKWASNATRESPPGRAGQSTEGLCWSHRPALERSEAGPPLPRQHPRNSQKLRGGISGEATISLPYGMDFCAPSSNPQLPSFPRTRDQHPRGIRAPAAAQARKAHLA